MSMDVNTIRVTVLVLGFVGFLAIVWWAWSKANRSRFEDAARLPFTGEGENGRE